MKCLVLQVPPVKILTKKKNKSGKDAQPSSKNPNLIGLYFSASWCPPCKTFTPLLTEFYNTAKKTCPDEFEIIFVSSDRTQEEFDGYYEKMPWLAIPPVEGSAKIKATLSSTLGVTAIPALAIIDGKTGEFIAGGIARDDVMRVTESGECTPDQVKVILAKWKRMERKSMLEAPREMDAGSGAQSFLGKVLGFFAKNPMMIFGLIYIYRFVQRKMIEYGYDDDSSDGGSGDVVPPPKIEDNEF